MTMGDRWESEARRLAMLDRSIESIKEALRSAYDAGRAEQREAGAKVCDEQPDRSPAATYLYAPYGTGCRDCAAAIRAQNLSGSPELDPGDADRPGVMPRSASTAPSGVTLSTDGVGAGAKEK